MRKDQLILALDVPSATEALMWMNRLQNRVGCFKIGLQLFCAHGPELIRQAAKGETPIFLDLKLHDIPNTVASAVRSLSPLNIKFLTIHTQGGVEMIAAAQEALPENTSIQLLGVTVLTSLDNKNMETLGYQRSASEQAIHLAQMSSKAGLKGFVCSPLEASALTEHLPDIKALVTPGVRPAGSDQGDQSRVTTPEKAIQNGATHVVIGRPILQAKSPEMVIDSILNDSV
ncbi:MAG: orotidine-5'-phosphate decarboxylase [Verrucomicrobiota bacterium]